MDFRAKERATSQSHAEFYGYYNAIGICKMLFARAAARMLLLDPSCKGGYKRGQVMDAGIGFIT